MKLTIKIKILIISVIIFSVLNIIASMMYQNEVLPQKLREKDEKFNLKSSSYWNLTGNPIYINDNDIGVNDWETINATYDWCTGSGTKQDPYVLENILIDGLNTGNCIEIWYSSVYFTIKNCTLYNSGEWDCGMYLYDVHNAKIHNNTIHSNFEGIFFQGDGDYNNITNNIVKDNGRTGIVLESFNEFCIINNNIAINNYQHGIVLRQECLNNRISNNFVKNHIYSGILIQGGSNNNTIIGNTAVRNAFAGLWIYNSDDNIFKQNNFSSNIGYGIEVTESNKNTVKGNYIFNNSIYGIEFDSNDHPTQWAIYNRIISNNITNNEMAGIHLDPYAMNNSIYLNNFIDNGVINGYDEGINKTNSWDNGTIGNYWDDYSGLDMDDDGIGDTPYIDIGGTVGAQDNYPIWWDSPKFTIVSPFPSEQFGDIAPNYIINIDEGINHTMWYTLDNGITNHTFVKLSGHIDQSLWNSTGKGILTIRFYINDSRGYISYQEVTVEKVRFEKYWYLDPFILDDSGGGDYTWAEAVSYAWCSGSGTLLDPYMIEFIRINGQNSSSCLTIQNSNVYFVISNSSFYNSSGGFSDAGIKLHSTSNGLIIRNNCSFNNGNGIVLSSSQHIIITKNSINSNIISGIYLLNSDDNWIFENDETINNNDNYGILLVNSNYNNITNNIVNQNNIGVSLQNSNYNTIINNDLFNNNMPYELLSGVGNDIQDDSFPSDSSDFLYEFLIIILIIGVVAVVITGSVIITRKRRSV